MKKMRKGIVVLVVSAAAAVGSIGGVVSAEAQVRTPKPGGQVVKTPGAGVIQPQARGSSWQ